MMGLDQIKKETERLARLIDAGESLLPTYGYSDGTGKPHVEIDSSGYHYVQTERGQEFDRWTTLDFDELLYAIFRTVSFEMASNFEVQHPVAKQDPRRLLFQRQIELGPVNTTRTDGVASENCARRGRARRLW